MSVFHWDAVRSYISTHGLLPAKRFVQQGCRKAKYLPQTLFSSYPFPVFHFNGLVLAGFYSTNSEANDCNMRRLSNGRKREFSNFTKLLNTIMQNHPTPFYIITKFQYLPRVMINIFSVKLKYNKVNECRGTSTYRTKFRVGIFILRQQACYLRVLYCMNVPWSRQ